MTHEMNIDVDQATAFFAKMRQSWSILANMFSPGPFRLISHPSAELLQFKGRTLTLVLPVIDPKKKLLTRRLADIMQRGWYSPSGDKIDLLALQMQFAVMAQGLPFLTDVKVVAGFDSVFDTRNGFVNPPSEIVYTRDYPSAVHSLINSFHQVSGSATTSTSVITDSMTGHTNWGVSVVLPTPIVRDLKKVFTEYVARWVVENYKKFPPELAGCSVYISNYLGTEKHEVTFTQLGRAFCKRVRSDYSTPGVIRASRIVQKMIRAAFREEYEYEAWDHPMWSFSKKSNALDPRARRALKVKFMWAQTWVMRETFRNHLRATNTKLYVTYKSGHHRVDVAQMVDSVVAHVMGHTDIDWLADSWNARAKQFHSRALFAKQFLKDTPFMRGFVSRAYESDEGYFTSVYGRTQTDLSFGKWMELQQKLKAVSQLK